MQKFNVRNILVAAVGVLIILFAEPLGFFDGINAYCYNLAFRVRGPLAPSSDILIVAIDEKSLGQLGQWPLRRSNYADLLDRLTAARAVGFAVIMEESTGEDLLLAQAAARHGRAAFSLYIGNRLQVESPSYPLASFPAGHLHIEQDMNGFVRSVFTHIKFKNRTLPSLAETVLEIAGGSPLKADSTLSQNSPAKSMFTGIKQRQLLQINYYGPPGTFPVVSLADILQDKIPPELFKSKMILVGVTAAGIEIQQMTPFALDRNRMSAVEIQANILNNLVARSNIRSINENSRFLAGLVIAIILFALYMYLTETGAALLCFLTGIAMMTSGYFLFARLNIWVEPGSFLMIAGFLYLSTFLFKLDRAARKLQQECSTIALHLGAETGRQSHGNIFAGLFNHLSPGGINRKINILEEATRQLMQRSIEVETVNCALEGKNSQLGELQVALKARVVELEEAFGRVRQLEGIIPICMYCKKIRDDQDYWQKLEIYLAEHSDIAFSHGICPDCFQEKIRELDE